MGYSTRDLPWSITTRKTLPHFEFENWAGFAPDGVPNVTQVGDMGIGGKLEPVNTNPATPTTTTGGPTAPTAPTAPRAGLQIFFGSD